MTSLPPTTVSPSTQQLPGDAVAHSQFITDLNTNIQMASFWEMLPAGQRYTFRPRLFNHAGSGKVLQPFPEQGYTCEDLALIDPRLPDVMEAMWRTLHTSTNEIFGSFVRDTMSMWNGGFLDMPCAMLKNIPSLFRTAKVLAEDFSVEAIRQDDGNYVLDVCCDAYMYHTFNPLVPTPHGRYYSPEKVGYIAGRKRASGMTLNQSWLDCHRPNWRAIVSASETLELGPDTLAHLLMFAEPEELAVTFADLTGVAFD